MKYFRLFVAACLLAAAGITSAQVTLPQARLSQHAKVTQTVGLSEITIDYSRPGVKGREVWGKLVPYGMTNLGFGTAKESPWRAGANENTTITFSDDVKINGKYLPAGTYGLHMIPTENEWTIIFNKVSTAWGSFFYDPNMDALRVTATPEKSDFTEWLMYGFDNLSLASADVYLKWDNLKIKFTAAFDVNNIRVEKYREALVGSGGFNWQNYQAAAASCLARNINLDEAEKWIDHSLEIQKTPTNMLTKSLFLRKDGKTDEADELFKTAVENATETDLNNYGYSLINVFNDLEGALKIFKINIDKFPNSWNVYDSYGEAWSKMGDKENAIKYYKMALDKAPDNQKDRINGIIKNLM